MNNMKTRSDNTPYCPIRPNDVDLRQRGQPCRKENIFAGKLSPGGDSPRRTAVYHRMPITYRKK